tara:strand:- start:261 stop:1742 length:1482 start_codon:yes stop_codon:yes gene_type:complete
MLRKYQKIFLLGIILSSKAHGSSLFIADKFHLSNIENQFPGEDNLILNLTHPPLIHLNKSWQRTGFVISKVSEKPIAKRKTLQSIWQVNEKFNWSNGQPVTATDIKRTLEYLRLKYPVYNQMIKNIKTDKLDKRTVIFELRKSRGNLEQLLSIRLLPKNPGQISSYGPYQIKQQSKNKVILTENKHYSKKKFFSKITIQNFSKIQNLLAKSRKNKMFITNSQINALEITNNIDILSMLGTAYKKYDSASLKLLTIFLNKRNPGFQGDEMVDLIKQPVLRSAKAFAKKRNLLIANSFMHPSDPICPVFSSATKHPERKTSKPFSDSIEVAYKKTKEIKEFLKILSTNLKNKGFAVTKLGYDPDVFRNKIIPMARYKDIIITEWEIAPSVLPFSVLIGRTPSSENDYIGQNLSGWTNPAVEHIMKTKDISDTKKCSRLHQLVKKYTPFIPLYFLPRKTILHQDLQRFQILEPSYPYSMTNLYSQWTTSHTDKFIQ